MKGVRHSVYYYTGGIHLPAGIAWIFGILVGLVFTTSPWFTGPLARGVFAQSSLGFILGFVVAGLTYWLFVRWEHALLRSARPELIAAREEGSPTGHDHA